jgi:hypothetical protein
MLIATAVSLLQGRTLPDTTVVRMVPVEPTGAQNAMAVATILAVVLPYLLLAIAIWAGLRARKSFEHARVALDGVGARLRDLSDNAGRIASDVANVTHAVQANVVSVNETIEYANQRARDAVSALADRIDDFNTTLGVVQRDTQDVVVTALAALRGVRAGVRAMRRTREDSRHKRAKLDGDEVEADEDVPPDLPARPRLRRSARKRS